MKKYLSKILLTFSTALLIPLSACAAGHTMKKPENGGDDVKFTIGFKGDGSFVVRGRDGKVLEPKRLNLPQEPFKVDAIVDFHTIIEAKGSCFILINGFWYRFC